MTALLPNSNPASDTPDVALPPLLIVDDDEAIRFQMKWALCSEYRVFLAENRSEAVDLFRRESLRVVTLDLGLPPHPRDATEGLRTLREILTIDPAAKVLIISGNADRKAAISAIHLGAYDFFSKPIDVHDMRVILRRAYQLYGLEAENRRLRQQHAGRDTEAWGIVGTSQAMVALYADIRKVASTDVPVLILGESGTGKELTARAIHRQSRRAAGPFVAINCAAIPGPLLESELFGHEKGAFTGAHARKPGRIESAADGTILLDEIGEMPVDLQVKLLRFLQEKRLERVGGREVLEVDVRVLAATNRNVADAISRGQLREDLFFRLGVVSLVVPPLRERRQDIALLGKTFLTRAAAESGKGVLGFTPAALVAMGSYLWPGNVREMENKIRRGVAMAEGDRLTAADMELPSNGEGQGEWMTLRVARDQMEKQMVESAMAQSGGQQKQAATALGLTRPALRYLIAKYHLQIDPTPE